MSDLEERIVSGLTVRIDRPTCIASKNCIHLAPEVFELGEDQVVTFRDDAEDIDRDRLIEACRICPVDALGVWDAEGRRLV